MSTEGRVTIRDAELERASDADALFAILDAYAREPGGQSAPLSEAARAALVPGLRAHPHTFVLLACVDARPVGAAVCFFGFSTFAGRPFLNVHDLALLPGERGRGLGRALLEETERRARARGCAKMTLEVHQTNTGAQRLYRDFGFAGWDAPTYFVTKRLAS
jgi:ribosomal protein S18 acetylase RimI-like enzyme